VSKFFTTKKTGVTLSEVNVIPLVDIVFTLLIIFMIMAPMIHKGIEVQVPESSVGETVPERTHHIITITKEGLLWFDNQEVLLEELQGYLQDVSSEDTIYVQSDRNVPYGHVITVITAIKETGLRNVGLITNPVTKSEE
jgi:biopolymer transport protein TolR